MPELREMVEEEAARAEAADDDEAEHEDEQTPTEPTETPEEETPAEQAPEVPPADQPPTEAEVKAIMAKLEKEDARHTKRYAEVLGDQFALMQPCPRCLESGHIYPVELAPLDPDQVAAVDASLGRAIRPELKEAPDTERCEVCDGWGEVETKARNPNSLTKPCTPCGGLGWVPAGAQNQPAAPAGGGGQQANGEGNSAEVVDLRDAWGRPSGHPHWGSDPATIGV